MRLPIPLAFTLLGLLGPGSATAAPAWRGKVVGVLAGDQLIVQEGSKRVHVELAFVDAPELGQPFGKHARLLTKKLALGKRVNVVPVDGRHGRGARIFASVYLPRSGGIDHYADGSYREVELNTPIDEVLLKAGLAWVRPSAAGPPGFKSPLSPAGARRLTALVIQAKRVRRGLWAGKKPVAPWVWRQRSQPRPSKPALTARPSHDKSRACRSAKDCVFRPPSNCGCPPCGPTWRSAVNRAHAAWVRHEQARESCPRVKCAKCAQPLRWLGSRLLCVRGQCDIAR